MISPQLAQKVLEAGLAGGADFAEIFVEDSYSSMLSLIDSKPEQAVTGRDFGAGIRLFYGTEQIYVTTNDVTERGLMKAAKTAAQAKRGVAQASVSNFHPQSFDEIHKYGTRPSGYSRDKKYSYLTRLDRSARKESSLVVQVMPWLMERTQKVLVANSLGVWAEDERNWVRTGLEVTLEDQGQRQSASERSGVLGTSEYFESLDLEAMAKETTAQAKTLLHAEYAPAGEFPVVIGGGDGVIFHEACGHGLETTSVAQNASVFCGKLGECIAHECVSAIDDGTIAGSFGSIQVDDEGMPTQKTVLIENGILKSYMVDQIGARKTGFKPTGSGRRQNYKLAPTSRMRNTYIAAGKDRFEDLISDVDYGIYAKSMGGGSVSPGTGEYNFGVREAYLIKNGRIEQPLKGVILIGRGIETLGRITKVSNDLGFGTGMCGSVSGSIPVTCGQPALLVSKILVGGRAK